MTDAATPRTFNLMPYHFKRKHKVDDKIKPASKQFSLLVKLGMVSSLSTAPVTLAPFPWLDRMRAKYGDKL